MKLFVTLLFASITLILFHTQVKACDLDPTAVITLSANENVFLEGELVFLYSTSSSANCGYISDYRWQADGVTISSSYITGQIFTLQNGQESRTIDIQLRVQNSVGNYDYETVTITIVREHSSYYYLTDHLGSVRVTVDEQGNSIGWDDYYPFGLQMPGRTQNASNPNDDAKFTGYLLEQEGDLGLYHANARMYDPVIGRFMQVDPALSISKPVELFEIHNGALFSYSPYHYVFNNPTGFTDPSGEVPLGLFKRVVKFSLKLAQTRSVDAAVEAVTGGIQEDFATVTDSEASVGERALAGGSLASEIFSPVSARDTKNVGNALGFGKKADKAAGGIQNLSNKQLKKAGVDAEFAKMSIVGEKSAGKFNIGVDSNTNEVFLTPVKKGSGPNIPTDYKLDELANDYPLNK